MAGGARGKAASSRRTPILARAPKLEMEEAGLGDGGDGADGVEDGGGDFAVYADEGDGMGALLGRAAAEGECGDVDAELTEGGTDMADYAGLVIVAEIQESAFEVGFERDALDH